MNLTSTRIQEATLPDLYATKQNLERSLQKSGYCCLCHFIDKCRFGDPDRIVPDFDDRNPKNIYHDRCRDLTWIAEIDAQIKIKTREGEISQEQTRRREQKVLDYHLRHPQDTKARTAASQMGLLSSPFQTSSPGRLKIVDEPTPGLAPQESSCTTLAYVCLAVAAVAALVALAAAALFFFPVLSLSAGLVVTALKVSTGACVAFGLLGTALKLCC